jgi:asparagine synthase (glutamine-hydrolysing)
VRKLANYYEKMATRTSEDFYTNLASMHTQPESLVMGATGRIVNSHPPSIGSLTYAEWMMLADALTYFPGDILTKIDRAAMAVSLETRTPFTDPGLIAFAWQLPLHMKIRGRTGKWLLREVLRRHVPNTLIDRPKAGFSIPLAQWLRHELKPWAEDLLQPDRLHAEGYFAVDAVRRLWNQHQQGIRDHEKILWNILMFQSWLAAHQR